MSKLLDHLLSLGDRDRMLDIARHDQADKEFDEKLTRRTVKAAPGAVAVDHLGGRHESEAESRAA